MTESVAHRLFVLVIVFVDGRAEFSGDFRRLIRTVVCDYEDVQHILRIVVLVATFDKTCDDRFLVSCRDNDTELMVIFRLRIGFLGEDTDNPEDTEVEGRQRDKYGDCPHNQLDNVVSVHSKKPL